MLAPKATVNPFAVLLGQQALPLPWRSSAFKMYKKLHCPNNVAPFFSVCFKLEQDRYNTMPENERIKTKKPTPIRFRTKLYHEYFKHESEEERNRYQELADQAYKSAMEEHRALSAVKKSPRDYYQ